MKAIIFDFDGTIANTLPVMFYSFRKVFKTFDNKDYSDEEIKAMFGPPEPELIRQNLNSTQTEEAIELYYREYENNHADLVKKSKDVNHLLSWLKERGFNLGIVTGKSSKSFILTLEKLEIERYFDVAITGDDVRKPKPDTEGLMAALSKLDAEPGEAMYIGDSDNDILAGKNAKVTVAASKWLPEYETSEYTAEPDAVFHHTSDMIDFIKNKLF